MPNSTPRGLKILMLHGYTQSGPQFRSKSRVLEKALQKAFPNTTFHYPTAPHQLQPADVPGYTTATDADIATATTTTTTEASTPLEAFAWWRRDDGTGTYHGLEAGLARVAATITADGPFDGVIGFSQGAAAAAMVASLLEPGRRRAWRTGGAGMAFPAAWCGAATAADADADDADDDEEKSTIQAPLRFAVEYSGFAAPAEGGYGGFYEPRIATPVLHFVGALDTVVDEERTRALVARCEDGERRVMVHPGGHYVPTGKTWVEAVVGFVRECVAGGEEKAVESKEVEMKVEDMDVPF